MFRKREEPVRDNTESQITMEQIRRRMVANVAGSEAPMPADIGPEIDTVASQYPALPADPASYESVQQSLSEARGIGDIIAEANRETSSSNGIGGMLRNSMRWYTAPEEAYWNGVIGSMDRILSALQAHDAAVTIHSNAIRSLQEQTATLTQQLSEISDTPVTHKERSES